MMPVNLCAIRSYGCNPGGPIASNLQANDFSSHVAICKSQNHKAFGADNGTVKSIPQTQQSQL
jgi:hypothetical protein